MLTERERAMLLDDSIRDLRLEIKILRDELATASHAQRRRWIVSRIDSIQGLIDEKLSKM